MQLAMFVLCLQETGQGSKEQCFLSNYKQMNVSMSILSRVDEFQLATESYTMASSLVSFNRKSIFLYHQLNYLRLCQGSAYVYDQTVMTTLMRRTALRLMC